MSLKNLLDHVLSCFIMFLATLFHKLDKVWLENRAIENLLLFSFKKD